MVSELEPSRIATPLVLSLLSNIIFMIIVNGTESNMPTGPSTQPQNIKDKNTTNVESPKPLPNILTSRIEPKIVFVTRNPIAVSTALPIPN